MLCTGGDRSKSVQLNTVSWNWGFLLVNCWESRILHLAPLSWLSGHRLSPVLRGVDGGNLPCLDASWTYSLTCVIPSIEFEPGFRLMPFEIVFAGVVRGSAVSTELTLPLIALLPEVQGRFFSSQMSQLNVTKKEDISIPGTAPPCFVPEELVALPLVGKYSSGLHILKQLVRDETMIHLNDTCGLNVRLRSMSNLVKDQKIDSQAIVCD